MKRNVLGAGLLMLFAGGVFGQQTLVGKYTGNYVDRLPRGEVLQSLTLEIASVDGDRVKGRASRFANSLSASSCNGTYDLEGTLKGNDLELRSVDKSRPADCNTNFKLTVDGNKLVGMMGDSRTTLSK